MALWGLEFMTPSAWGKRFPGRLPKASSLEAITAPDRRAPPSTPEVAPALPALKELNQAIERAAKAWNRTQLIDAMRSVKYWTQQVEQAAKIVDLT
jgi:hypothetical protein